MNVKDIKTMRWHKQSMINVMKTEGIEVRDIDIILDNIIDNLDEKRRSEDPIKKARAEGYEAGCMDGRFGGYSDGWDDARAQYEDYDRHNPQIKIKEHMMDNTLYCDVYVDGEYIGYRWSESAAIKMGDEYIAGRRNQ
jgi:hypothetical protein